MTKGIEGAFPLEEWKTWCTKGLSTIFGLGVVSYWTKKALYGGMNLWYKLVKKKGANPTNPTPDINLWSWDTRESSQFSTYKSKHEAERPEYLWEVWLFEEELVAVLWVLVHPCYVGDQGEDEPNQDCYGTQ